MDRSSLIRVVPLLALAAALPSTALGQAYPTKSIRLLIGFPPGGAADIAGRIMGEKMSDSLGRPVVVDNRPGAGSAIASEMAAKATPDGYTLLMIGSSHAVNAAVRKNLPYDSVKDFAAIVLVSSSPVVLSAHPAMPVKTLKDLIAAARAKPGVINYASAGVGGINHLAGEMFKRMANINLMHVPYKGVAQALPPVMAGEVQLLFSSLPGSLPQIKAGRIRAIAVTSAKRSSAAPEIPTMDESGLRGYEATSWNGILAPAATPRAIVQKLNFEAVKALASSDVKEAILRMGADPSGSTPGEFGAYLKSEVAKWTKVVRESGIKAE